MLMWQALLVSACSKSSVKLLTISIGFPGGTVVENLPANAGDPRDAGSVLGLGRSLEEEIENYCNILAWKIPWTEEPGGLPTVCEVTKESDMTEWLSTSKKKKEENLISMSQFLVCSMCSIYSCGQMQEGFHLQGLDRVWCPPCLEESPVPWALN